MSKSIFIWLILLSKIFTNCMYFVAQDSFASMSNSTFAAVNGIAVNVRTRTHFIWYFFFHLEIPEWNCLITGQIYIYIFEKLPYHFRNGSIHLNFQQCTKGPFSVYHQWHLLYFWLLNETHFCKGKVKQFFVFSLMSSNSEHVCVCAYVHVCLCRCICARLYVCMCVYVCVCICACVYMCMCVHVCVPFDH